MSRRESLATKLSRVGLSIVIALFTQVILYFIGEAILLHGDSPRIFMLMTVAVMPNGGIAVFAALVLMWYAILSGTARLNPTDLED